MPKIPHHELLNLKGKIVNEIINIMFPKSSFFWQVKEDFKSKKMVCVCVCTFYIPGNEFMEFIFSSIGLDEKQMYFFKRG